MDMKIKKLVMNNLLLLASAAALSACVLTGGTKATDAEAKAEQKPAKNQVYDTKQEREDALRANPQLAISSGGEWTGYSESGGSKPVDSHPAKPMITSDTIDLQAKRDPKAELSKRALERWALLIARRGEEAYDYLTPGYQKTHDRAKYGLDMNNRPVRWFRASYQQADCISEISCEVTIFVEYKVRIAAAMGPTESFAFIKERWLKLENVWYYLKEETGD